MNRPLRIVLIMQGGLGWMGGMEYIRNIILALASLPQDIRETFEISLITSNSVGEDFLTSVRPYLKHIHIIEEIAPMTLFRLGLWFTKDVFRKRFFDRSDNRYDRILNKTDYDFAYPNTTSRSGFSFSKATPWIYDFQHKYLPDLFTPKEIRERDRNFSLMCSEGSIIVLSSMSAESDFKKFHPEAAAKARVLSFRTIPQPQWFEIDPLDIQRKYSLPDKFFIISNQFWMHKNHLVVLKALELLKDRGIHPVVVCTGHIYDYRKPDYSDIILQTIHRSGLAQQVYLLGLIPKTDQIQLLRRSIALIQPSLFEGWSTVVEDARCFGKPMILSDFPVHLEQNPPNSRFFERTSPESLVPALEDYWNRMSPGPDQAEELRARDQNKKEIEIFAHQFLEIAHSAVNNQN